MKHVRSPTSCVINLLLSAPFPVLASFAETFSLPPYLQFSSLFFDLQALWLCTGLPTWHMGICQSHWPQCHQAITLSCCGDSMCASGSPCFRALCCVAFPDFRLAPRYLLSYTALAPLWRAGLCLQRPLPRFLQSCRIVLCLRGNPFAILILVFVHQEAEDCSGLEAKESWATWWMVTIPQRRSQEEGILTDDALSWI